MTNEENEQMANGSPEKRLRMNAETPGRRGAGKKLKQSLVFLK
jgi:hypothetical protein